MTRPRLAVPPGNRTPDSGPFDSRPSAWSVGGLAPAPPSVSQVEQGAGETRVGDEAMDHIPSDRGVDRRALGDAKGDGKDERDPLERRAWRHDHAAVQRGRDGPAVLADEHPGQLGAYPQPGQGVTLGRRDGVIDRRQPWRPGADG